MSYATYRVMPVFCIGPFLMATLGLLVVAGLVATPATCDCGAGIPHAHSIFMLAGHHHRPSGEHVKLASHKPGEARAHHLYASGEPRVQEMAGHATDRQAMLAGELQTERAAWQRWAPRYAPVKLLEGQVTRPDPGPPRLYA